MTFYQELQLSSVGSKQLIKSTKEQKEKNQTHTYFIILRCIWIIEILCCSSDAIYKIYRQQ